MCVYMIYWQNVVCSVILSLVFLVVEVSCYFNHCFSDQGVALSNEMQQYQQSYFVNRSVGKSCDMIVLVCP